MQSMGALQPGLPCPNMLPENWHILIIELKDCFFTIPLCPQDTQRFAFSVPAINKAQPARRFEWVVLPQGMKNSPTLYQMYVTHALRPIRVSNPEVIIYHYMDDILFYQKQPFTGGDVRNITDQLMTRGLIVAPEKVQLTKPWKYLRWTIEDTKIRPQKLSLKIDIQTLKDLQTFLGDVQWVRTCAGISNVDIQPLTELVAGAGNHPAAPINLDTSHQTAIGVISDKLVRATTSRRLARCPLSLYIGNVTQTPFTVICQWQTEMRDLTLYDANDRSNDGSKPSRSYKSNNNDIRILEWVFLSVQPKTTVQSRTAAVAELIRKGRLRTLEIAGEEPADTCLPVPQQDVDWWLAHDASLQTACLNFPGKIHSRTPKSRMWQTIGKLTWLRQPDYSERPLQNALTVYTDAGKRTKRAVCVWPAENRWEHHLIMGDSQDSLQTLELTAILWAFETWSDVPINVVSDSLYAVGIVSRIEDALLRKVHNERLNQLFLRLRAVISPREQKYCVIHVRSHQFDFGLGKGNQAADALVSMAAAVPPMNIFQQARQSHELFRQNARGLQRQFNLTENEAKGIVQSCPQCQHNAPGLGVGVSPKGLKALELWQMDVTHVPQFGRMKYVHVSIDTFSKAMWATALSGEKAHHVCKHLMNCFAILGVPETIKTDNGPAYCSQKVRHFMQQWGVKHSTGIPHNPTGQAMIERAHRTLKEHLNRQPKELEPSVTLTRTLFVLNHLCITGDREIPPMALHHQTIKLGGHLTLPKMWVHYKHPQTGIWMGPASVIFNGRGYMCVSTDNGPLWVPSRWTRKAEDPLLDPDHDDRDGNIITPR